LPKQILMSLAIVAIGVGMFVVDLKGALSSTSGAHLLAPDFSLRDLSGQTVTLASYRGKVVLLDFWATWCTPCREEIPRFVELQSKYGAQGLQIIGISMDDEEDQVRDFDATFPMNYPVVMGNARIGELYGGVLGLPVAFLIGREGRIEARHAGAVGFAQVEAEIRRLLDTR
jgi:peroxiredoxin